MSILRFGVEANIYRSISIYTASIFILGFLIPLVVISVSYCIILYTAVHMMPTANESVSTMREIRVAKTISLVIGLFVISWSPFFIVNMVVVFCASCARPKWLVHVSKMMHYSNSIINLFVYGVRSPEFRNFFIKILCPKQRRRNKQHGATFTELTNLSFNTKLSASLIPSTCNSRWFILKLRIIVLHTGRSFTIHMNIWLCALQYHFENKIHYVILVSKELWWTVSSHR